MTTTQSIFVVFFAIFWGSVASVQGRWKMFHWPLIQYRHVQARLALSFFVLNVLPVLFFALVFILLRNTPTAPVNQWSYSEILRQVIAGVVPAFAVFGFYRLWIAVVEFCPECFYQRQEQQREEIRNIEPTIEELDIGAQFRCLNLLFALLYLTVAGAVPWLLT